MRGQLVGDGLRVPDRRLLAAREQADGHRQHLEPALPEPSLYGGGVRAGAELDDQLASHASINTALNDDEFLQWALPRAGLRWAGFRKPRRQVLRRLRERVEELGLDGLDAYGSYLEANPDEWSHFVSLTPVTISRFYRDRAVFAALEAVVLPALRPRRAWSAGCASGEEAYTLALIAPELEILATDIHEPVLCRARAAVYPESSFAELPDRLRARMRDGTYRERVEIRRHDLREEPPDGPFDLILCRNSAFTYFADDVQAQVLERLLAVLRPGGALVAGLHEHLPLEPWPGARAVYPPPPPPPPPPPRKPRTRSSTSAVASAS